MLGALAHLPEELRQVVGDKPIHIGKEFRPEFGYFPAGQVIVHPVKESGVVGHCFGERFEQMGCFQ